MRRASRAILMYDVASSLAEAVGKGLAHRLRRKGGEVRDHKHDGPIVEPGLSA